MHHDVGDVFEPDDPAFFALFVEQARDQFRFDTVLADGRGVFEGDDWSIP